MNKSQLIDKIAADAGITKGQAGDALSAFTDAIKNTLKGDDRVTLIGFGTFSITERKAREGRNPKTGATLQIPAKKVVKFKPGKELEAAVN